MKQTESAEKRGSCSDCNEPRAWIAEFRTQSGVVWLCSPCYWERREPRRAIGNAAALRYSDD